MTERNLYGNNQDQDRPPQELLTVGDAATLLNVHVNTLRRWEAQGLIPAWRLGPRQDRRFRKSDVKSLLENSVKFQPKKG